MQPNRSEQEARVPGTTRAVPWQRGREASSGNGVTRLAPAPLAGTKQSFILPGRPPAPAPTFPLHLDTSPLLPAVALGPVRCWQQSAGTKPLASSILIAPAVPWLSPLCFQLQRWLPRTLQSVLHPFFMLWSSKPAELDLVLVQDWSMMLQRHLSCSPGE